jgi:predicted nucleotidyltransferase
MKRPCYNHDMSLNKTLIPPNLIEPFCRKHHIRNLAVFGSFARNDFHPDSDVDILVDFEPGYVPGFDFFLMEAELSKLLGSKVDLQTASFLSPSFRQSALSEAVTVYEQA